MSQACTHIFPLELWGIILDTMEDSTDIQSVLGAFPELSDLFHGKKANWFFDRVFPHIFKQFYGFCDSFDRQTLLALRTVSKSWCDIIEDFLENHPSCHPHNHNGINRRKLPYGQFNYFEQAPKLVRLDGTEMIEKCYSELMNHPRNPFILGRLIISNLWLEFPHDPFLEASLVFLRKYGHYISTFEFLIEITPRDQLEVEEVESILRKIFECISCTGRIKFLKIHLFFEHDNLFDLTRNMFTPDSSSQIPQLPHLETLIVDDISYRGFPIVSNSFSVASCIINRIKRLEAPLYCNMFHNNKSFPNVCEMSLDISGACELDFRSLQFLNKINCPLLRKLAFIGNASITICINELFSVLARLELAEMLLLRNCQIINDKKCNLFPIPGIKYFRVGDGFDHGFEFLKMFTSLEHLHLHFQDSPEVTREKIKKMRSFCRKDRGFSSQLRTYMYESVVPEGVNIWDALPTVKFVTVEKVDSYWQYSRECGNKSFPIM